MVIKTELNLSGSKFTFISGSGFDGGLPFMLVEGCAVRVAEISLPCGVILDGDAINKIIREKLERN